MFRLPSDRGRRSHEDTPSVLALDESLGLEQCDGLADGPPGGAEVVHHVPLARQLLTGSEFAICDALSDAVCYLLVDRSVGAWINGPKRHRVEPIPV